MFYLVLTTVSIFFVIYPGFASASPMKDSFQQITIENATNIIEENVNKIKERVNEIEDDSLFFESQFISNSFGYKGNSPEDMVKPFDFYNLRPMKSGFSFSNRSNFTFSKRLNYDLMAEFNLKTYSFSGDSLPFWGVFSPYGDFSQETSTVAYGSVKFKAKEPDISGTFGDFYSTSLSELVYSSPQNFSIYGPETLPARGFRLGANIKPLSFELIGGIEKERIFFPFFQTSNDPESIFLIGGRGSFSFNSFNMGTTYLHSEKEQFFQKQDTLALDFSREISGDLIFKGEFSRSIFRNLYSRGANSFRISLGKEWGNFFMKVEYIWVSPFYDPFQLHKTFTERELLGIGKLANNRGGLDFYFLFPLKKGEIKLELLYFSQIEATSRIAEEKEKFLFPSIYDPLFPFYSEKKGTFKALQSSYSNYINEKICIKGGIEIVNLFCPSSFKSIDFTQATCLLEADFRLTDYFLLGTGLVYLKRKGTWYTIDDISQITPLIRGEIKINENFSLSLEHRNIIMKDFLDYDRNFTMNHTTLEASVCW